jgi:hypothetical protein
MKTDVAIVESKYNNFKDEFLQEDMEHMLEANERLESEVKRLRKDKEQLHELLCMMKKSSDVLWDRLRIDI